MEKKIKKSLFIFIVSCLMLPINALSTNIEGTKAKIGMLDKITGRFKSDTVKVGETLSFGNLKVKVNACMFHPPEETPENTAYLEIYEKKNNKQIINLFKGWMFSSNQVVTLNSPVFDVWILSCD